MQILVLGAYGYIGSQILDSLAAHPDYRTLDVVAVDNWSYGRGMAPVQAWFKEKLPHFKAYCHDMSEPSPTLQYLVDESDFIINAASLTQVPDTDLHVKYIRDGVTLLVEMIARSPGRLIKVIDISSTSIYGPVKTRMPEIPVPYTEKVFPDPAIAFHNYAASKLEVERLWQSDKCAGMPWTDFRLGTIFGYSIGMRYNQFIGQFLVDALVGRETTLPGAPGNFRPFCHVEDCADLMLHLLENDPGTNGEVINVGAQHLNPRLGDLFGSLARMLERDNGVTARYRFFSEIGTPPFEEDYQVDFSKLSALTSYQMRHDNFERGARDMVDKVLDLS